MRTLKTFTHFYSGTKLLERALTRLHYGVHFVLSIKFQNYLLTLTLNTYLLAFPLFISLQLAHS